MSDVVQEKPAPPAEKPKARKRKSSTAHPLSGANLGTLVKVIQQNGWPSANKMGAFAMALGSVLGRLPFTMLESFRTKRMIAKMPELEPPIFIVGHWRSGTTHLYNILSKAPDLGYLPPLATGLPWDMLGIAKVLKPLLEKTLPSERWIDRIPVTPESPQEDEVGLASMQPVSFYHGLYFPQHFHRNFDKGLYFEDCTEEEIEKWNEAFLLYVRKLTIFHEGKRQAIKNPVYTARIAHLANLVPGSKFVHIYRNPYMVFQSMRNFYHKLFKQLALQPYDHVGVDEHVLRTYPKMMRRAIEESKALPKDQLIEMRYEDLEARPMEELERMYTQLGIPRFAEAAPVFQEYLDSVKSYEKNSYKISDEDNRLVYEHWSEFIDRWGYEPPK